MATLAEEEKKKRRFGIGTISPEDQRRFDKTAQTGQQVVQAGKNVVSDISRAFSAAPAVAADYSSNKGSISDTITARQDPRKSIMDSAGRPERGFGGMATMPSKPNRGEAQAATLDQQPTEQPVQQIAATQQKRIFSPQQQPQQDIAKTSQFGGQFRPVPQRPGGGQMIEWYKDGEDPGYSYVDTPEAKAFNDARDREFGPMQVAPVDQLKKQYMDAQTPEDKKRISQDIAAISGATQKNTGLSEADLNKAELDINKGYQDQYKAGALGGGSPMDYVDIEQTIPLPQKVWAYKTMGRNARALYGEPDAETSAYLALNSDPDNWKRFIELPAEQQRSILQRFIAETSSNK